MTPEQLTMLRRCAPYSAEAVRLLYDHIDMQAGIIEARDKEIANLRAALEAK